MPMSQMPLFVTSRSESWAKRRGAQEDEEHRKESENGGRRLRLADRAGEDVRQLRGVAGDRDDDHQEVRGDKGKENRDEDHDAFLDAAQVEHDQSDQDHGLRRESV